MAPKSKKGEMENVLYVLHEDTDIDDEELLLLMPNHHRHLQAGLPYFAYDRFNSFELHKDECQVDFRFKTEDIF